MPDSTATDRQVEGEREGGTENTRRERPMVGGFDPGQFGSMKLNSIQSNEM